MPELHHLSIESFLVEDIKITRDPADIQLCETTFVTENGAPTVWFTATPLNIRVLSGGRWMFDVRTHTVGAATAEQPLAVGIYDVYVHLTGLAWADKFVFRAKKEVVVV